MGRTDPEKGKWIITLYLTTELKERVDEIYRELTERAKEMQKTSVIGLFINPYKTVGSRGKEDKTNYSVVLRALVNRGLELYEHELGIEG